MNVATLSTRLQQGAAHPLYPGIALGALGVALIAGAYAFQYLGGLKPCPLCLEQRVPWYVLIVLGGAIFGAGQAKVPRGVLIALYVAALGVVLWGAYLGGYHAGVEYKWWPGPAACTGGSLPTSTDLNNLSVDEIVRCDEVPWALFGVSLAGFNFLFSLAGAALAALGLKAIVKGGTI